MGRKGVLTLDRYTAADPSHPLMLATKAWAPVLCRYQAHIPPLKVCRPKRLLNLPMTPESPIPTPTRPRKPICTHTSSLNRYPTTFGACHGVNEGIWRR